MFIINVRTYLHIPTYMCVYLVPTTCIPTSYTLHISITYSSYEYVHTGTSTYVLQYLHEYIRKYYIAFPSFSVEPRANCCLLSAVCCTADCILLPTDDLCGKVNDRNSWARVNDITYSCAPPPFAYVSKFVSNERKKIRKKKRAEKINARRENEINERF